MAGGDDTLRLARLGAASLAVVVGYLICRSRVSKKKELVRRRHSGPSLLQFWAARQTVQRCWRAFWGSWGSSHDDHDPQAAAMDSRLRGFDQVWGRRPGVREMLIDSGGRGMLMKEARPWRARVLARNLGSFGLVVLVPIEAQAQACKTLSRIGTSACALSERVYVSLATGVREEETHPTTKRRNTANLAGLRWRDDG